MTKKTSKAYELINELRYNSKFQKEVNSLRKTSSIPLNGFPDIKTFNQWQEKLKFAEDFYDLITQLSIDYKVPSNMMDFLEAYIFYEDKFDDFMYIESVCELDTESGKGAIFTSADGKWVDGNHPFVKVFISDTASQEDAIKFIKSNWKKIQKQLSMQRDGSKKRIRRKTNLERDSRIRELYKMEHNKLGIKRGDYAKEKYIRDVIKAEFNTVLDFMTIRKIGSNKT